MSEAPEASPPAGYVQTVYGFDRPQSTSGEDVFPQALVESPSAAAIDPNSASVQVMETAPVDILLPYVDAAAPGLPGTFGDPVNRAPVVFGVSPVAGASTWAHLLGLVEVFTFEAVVQAASSGVPVVLVCRSTESSVAACFDFISANQEILSSIALILVVPDAPGRVIREVRHQIKILSGAHSVMQVPWISTLRAVKLSDNIPQSKDLVKAIKKINSSLPNKFPQGKEKS